MHKRSVDERAGRASKGRAAQPNVQTMTHRHQHVPVVGSAWGHIAYPHETTVWLTPQIEKNLKSSRRGHLKSTLTWISVAFAPPSMRICYAKACFIESLPAAAAAAAAAGRALSVCSAAARRRPSPAAHAAAA